MSDIRTVFRDIGALFMVMGFVTLIALVVPLYFGEYGPNSPFDAIGYILVTSAVFFGAGIAGIEASLLLSNSGRKIHLIEKTSYTGGTVIKFEEVFSNMECSTCMVAPRQQELLQDKNINLLTLTEVEDVKGSSGNFTVKIHKKARYVDMQNCIGCDACFEPCPVSLKNEFEEGLSERKAIYVPCAGALPNVPMIDTEHCIRFNGKDCKACQEACMFEAIDFNQKDEQIELKVGLEL